MEKSITFIGDWRTKLGTLAMALAIVSAAMTVRPARADEYEHHDPHWRAHEQRRYRHAHRHHRGYAPDVYYAPPPVVYVPPPPPGGFTFIFPFTIH